MGFQHYIFALYIFLLLMILLLVNRYVFSDLRRQKRLLDEKEAKILKIYEDLEEVMDDFHASVAEAKADISSAKRKVEQLAENAGAVKPPELSAPAAEEKKPPGRKKASKPPAAKAEPKQDAGDKPLDFRELIFTQDGDAEESRKPTRTEQIIELSNQDKDRHQIAKELEITLSEVDLVLGINKKRQ